MKKLLISSLTLILLLSLTACTKMTPTENTNNDNTTPVSSSSIEETEMISAVMVTNHGDITIELYPELVPETVKNFTTLAKEGKYDGVIFHRVIQDFMIQTGDFENGNGTGGYSYKGPGTLIPDEFHPSLTHEYGALSMANRGPNTGGSQFFIVQNQAGTDWLNGKHAVFGKVTDGMDVVEKIAALETAPGDKPLEEARIERIEVSE